MLLSYFDNKKAGQVALFIHGTASENGIWEKQYKLLNKSNFRVIGIDLRGHGKSVNPGGTCTMNDHVNDLKETLDYIGINEPIVIIGHSFGAVLGVKFAEMYSELVDKLLLVSLPPRVSRILLLYYKWFLGKPIKFMKKKLSIFSKIPVLKRYKFAMNADLSIIRQIWRDSLYWDFLTNRPKVQCPVYFSVGRFDHIALNSLIKKLHKELPNSSFKVFNFAAHNCMDDQPGEFNRWILSALAIPFMQRLS